MINNLFVGKHDLKKEYNCSLVQKIGHKRSETLSNRSSSERKRCSSSRVRLWHTLSMRVRLFMNALMRQSLIISVKVSRI